MFRKMSSRYLITEPQLQKLKIGELSLNEFEKIEDKQQLWYSNRDIIKDCEKLKKIIKNTLDISEIENNNEQWDE